MYFSLAFRTFVPNVQKKTIMDVVNFRFFLCVSPIIWVEWLIQIKHILTIDMKMCINRQAWIFFCRKLFQSHSSKILCFQTKKREKIISSFAVLKIKQICRKTEMEEATPMIVKNTKSPKRFLVCFLGLWTSS